jgi:GxxExxY protein
MDNDRYLDPSRQVIGLAIEVHRHLGPGLLERIYRESLCYELQQAGIPFERQKKLPLRYKSIHLNCNFQMDIVVQSALVVEITAVETFAPVHHAQLFSYLELGGIRLGLLLNFNAAVLKDGICRRRI